jgi:hypothetical protein
MLASLISISMRPVRISGFIITKHAAEGCEGFYEVDADGWDGLLIHSLERVLDFVDA